jgi:sodium-dependent dicarboxylate transporter 2/3/5
MPILAVVGISVGVDPAVFMVPAAMAASCAFMLPVATAPNAIVYGAGDIDIKEMVVEGALLSLIVSCIIAVITYAMLH